MADKRLVTGKSYIVRWKDHFSESSWKSPEEIEEWVEENTEPCTTRGTVVFQNRYIVVFSATDDGGGNYGDLMAIYKNCIVSKRRL